MAKLSFILLFSSLFIIALLPLAYSQETINIRVYLQDSFNRPNTEYGNVFGFQDPLTVGPDPNSTLLGRAQGTIAFSDRDNLQDLHVSLSYIFTSGDYNGSTIVAAGRNDVSLNFRQFPIVGGTGVFEGARGVVTGSTYSTDPAIYIYDLQVNQVDGQGIKMSI